MYRARRRLVSTSNKSLITLPREMYPELRAMIFPAASNSLEPIITISDQDYVFYRSHFRLAQFFFDVLVKRYHIIKDYLETPQSARNPLVENEITKIANQCFALMTIIFSFPLGIMCFIDQPLSYGYQPTSVRILIIEFFSLMNRNIESYLILNKEARYEEGVIRYNHAEILFKTLIKIPQDMDQDEMGRSIARSLAYLMLASSDSESLNRHINFENDPQENSFKSNKAHMLIVSMLFQLISENIMHVYYLILNSARPEKLFMRLLNFSQDGHDIFLKKLMDLDRNLTMVFLLSNCYMGRFLVTLQTYLDSWLESASNEEMRSIMRQIASMSFNRLNGVTFREVHLTDREVFFNNYIRLLLESEPNKSNRINVGDNNKPTVLLPCDDLITQTLMREGSLRASPVLFFQPALTAAFPVRSRARQPEVEVSVVSVSKRHEPAAASSSMDRPRFQLPSVGELVNTAPVYARADSLQVQAPTLFQQGAVEKMPPQDLAVNSTIEARVAPAAPSQILEERLRSTEQLGLLEDPSLTEVPTLGGWALPNP